MKSGELAALLRTIDPGGQLPVIVMGRREESDDMDVVDVEVVTGRYPHIALLLD
jgi:hypothetical protein